MQYEKRVNKTTGNILIRVVVGYQGRTPVRVSKTFPKGTPDRDIELWALLTKEKGLKAKDKTKTFDDIATEWLALKKPQLAVRTYKQYRYEVKRYCMGKLGDIDELTPDDLQKLLSGLFHLSPCCIGKARTYLRMILTYAVQRDYIQKSPLTGAIMIPRQRRKKRIEILTTEDFDRLAAALDKHLPLKTMLLTGLRVSELLALQPKHVVGDAIRVEQSLESRWGKRVITPPKSDHSYRTIAIPKSLAAELRNPKTSEFLFTQGYTFLGDNLKRTCEGLGLPKMTLHGLRHSHCVYLLAKGVNILAVSKRLGHHSPAFTLERYGHLIPSMNDKVLEALG